MPHKIAGFTVLLVCALLAATARADDGHKPPPAADPDPGFLEFLGSVDGLAEVNPDYLTQGNVVRPPPAAPAGAAVKPAAAPAAPPPASAAGVKNNE